VGPLQTAAATSRAPTAACVRTARTARSAKCLLLGTDCALTKPHRVVAEAIVGVEGRGQSKQSFAEELWRSAGHARLTRIVLPAPVAPVAAALPGAFRGGIHAPMFDNAILNPGKRVRGATRMALGPRSR
jgi:hypothetical protein